MSQFAVRGKPGVEPSASNPLEIAAMVQGVSNCVKNYAGVKKGEDVLIAAGYNDDPVVVQAFAAVCAEIGANVTVMYTKPPAHSGTLEPSDIAVQAYLAADVIIDLPFWSNRYTEKVNPASAKASRWSKEGKLTWQMNGRWVDLFGAADVITLSGPAARYPIPLLYEIGQRGKEILSKGKEIRLTDRNGTDIKLPLTNLKVLPPQPGPLGPGGLGGFMRGLLFTIGPYNPKPNGDLYFDEAQVTGVPEDPVKLTIENGQLTNIEGGLDAANLKLFFKKAPGGKLATEFSELGWGTNPKLPFKGGHEIQRGGSAGVVHYAIGAFYSGEHVYKATFTIDNPTVYVDDELMVDNRRLLLLEDPKLREIATKYGDPDKLLAQFMVHDY